MLYKLELPKGRLEGHRYDHRTAEGAIYDEFAGACRSRLGSMLLQPDFDAQDVPSAFLAAVDELAPDIIPTKVEDEKVWSDSHFQPVTRMIGILASRGFIEKPEDVALDPSFVEDIKDQISSLPYDFAELAEMHEVFSRNGSLEYVRKVWELGEEQPEGWLDKAYQLAEQAMHNPDCTLPLTRAESLYLICFMPHRARGLTRRVLVNNFVAASVEHKLGPDRSVDESLALEALKQFLKLEALEGQHWNDMAKYYEVSGELKQKLTLIGFERFDALRMLQDLTDQGKASRVAEAWHKTQKRLDGIISAFSDLDIREWELIDTGHCFQGFYDWELGEAFGTSFHRRREFVSPPKTGGYAVILEDDQAQRELYQRIVEGHTEHITDEGHVTADPSVAESFADDPDVGFYLIDIENGDDKFAGIRIAETIIRNRLEQIMSGEPESVPKTKIQIWSASPELVKVAKDHFEEILGRKVLPPELEDHVLFLCTSTREAVLDVQIDTKQWYSLKTPERPRTHSD